MLTGIRSRLLRDQGLGDWPWVDETWGHQQASVHVEEQIVFTKSRLQLTKSRGGVRELGDRVVEDGRWYTSRSWGRRSGYASPEEFGGLGLQTTDGWFTRLGLKTRDGVWDDTWRHHEACVEAKQSHEELVAIRCLDLKLDHYALRVKWFNKISKGIVGNV